MLDKPVIIIGGGPAGATCGGILSKHGIPCLLLEKDRHPKHHVGESLQPATIDLLETHLGIKDEIAAQAYAYKFGAVYIWGETREPWRILFDERLEVDLPNLTEAELKNADYEQAWQVHRSSFDRIIYESAKQQGLETMDNCEVSAVLFDGHKTTGVQLKSGEIIRASYVLDASGQRCLIGRQKNWIKVVEDLKSVAMYSYFSGCGGLEAPLGRHVQYIVTVPQGWVWFIPVSSEVTSIGLVTRENRKFSQQEFMDIIHQYEIPFNNGKMVEIDGFCGMRYARDWSYECTTLSGENFMLLGDAAMFVDPILSGGVDFAVRSGANAALALLQPDHNASFAAYEQQMKKDYQAYLRMARYWYGNNRNVEGFFWEAHQEIGGSLSTPIRAFVYLTSGRYAADQHLKVFQQWQEEVMFNALGVNKQQLKKALQKTRK
jgi:flavin-dependent dehydrogenase